MRTINLIKKLNWLINENKKQGQRYLPIAKVEEYIEQHEVEFHGINNINKNGANYDKKDNIVDFILDTD